MTDSDGNILEQFDYLPYGQKCNNSSLAVANQHKTDYLYIDELRNTMKGYVLCCLSFFALLLLSSCNKPSGGQEELVKIEEIIQSDPGEALEKLAGIDRDSLSGARGSALYSLLLSMALDKNYIDIKSDSLISPAVAYYSVHGDLYHKFLSYYYQGRVFENALQYQQALSSYITAESLLGPAIPKEYEVRLYCAKQRVYQHQFADEQAVCEILKAKKISQNLSNPEFYYRNALDLAAHYVKCGELRLASAELDSLRSWMAGKHVSRESDYYRSRLRTAMPAGYAPVDSIALWFDRYMTLCLNENTKYDHLLAADAYLALDQARNAEVEFQLCAEPADDYNRIMYFTTWSELYRRLGNPDKALEGRFKYEQAVERVSLGVFNNDVRFLEERHRNEVERQKTAYATSWLVLAIIVLSVFVIYAVLKSAKVKKKYIKDVQSVREEYAFIRALTNDADSPVEVREILQQRIEALRPYITNNKILPARRGRKGLEKLDEDRKNLLRSVGMIYALTYPGFVSELVSYSLTPEEIGLCSLYLSGYSSKELADLLSRGDIYHLNSAIRSKIGESVQNTKLFVWLRTRFAEHLC